jgi:hypothetical protein
MKANIVAFSLLVISHQAGRIVCFLATKSVEASYHRVRAS